MFNLFKSNSVLLSELEILYNGVISGTVKTLDKNHYSVNTFYVFKSALTYFKEFIIENKLNPKCADVRLMADFTEWISNKELSKNSIYNIAKGIRVLIYRLMKDEKIP